ncbi:hypothetical protein E2320_014391, partial [Naja naja]
SGTSISLTPRAPGWGEEIEGSPSFSPPSVAPASFRTEGIPSEDPLGGKGATKGGKSQELEPLDFSPLQIPAVLGLKMRTKQGDPLPASPGLRDRLKQEEKMCELDVVGPQMAPWVSLASQAGKSRESEGAAILNEENATHLDSSQDQMQNQGWQRQKLLEGLFLGEAEEDQVTPGRMMARRDRLGWCPGKVQGKKRKTICGVRGRERKKKRTNRPRRGQRNQQDETAAGADTETTGDPVSKDPPQALPGRSPGRISFVTPVKVEVNGSHHSALRRSEDEEGSCKPGNPKEPGKNEEGQPQDFAQGSYYQYAHPAEPFHWPLSTYSPSAEPGEAGMPNLWTIQETSVGDQAILVMKEFTEERTVAL